MPTSASVGYDAYAHCARCLIEEIDKELRQKVGPPTTFATVKSRGLAKDAPVSVTPIKPVGILGAGTTSNIHPQNLKSFYKLQVLVAFIRP